jgi:phage terminase large subunit-like protein
VAKAKIRSKSSTDSRHPHVDAGLKYARDVVAGRIIACVYVRQACRRQLDDLERQSQKSWPYRFDRGRGERFCRFMELLPHTKGKWAHKAERIKLESWQQFELTTVFGWVRKDNGLRRFREMYEEVPRKNGKSIKAAGIGLYMFSSDGEYGAEVYSGATSEKQAWEVFRPARLMAKRTPDLCEAYGIEVNASNLSRPDDGSRFEPLIGKPGDGASPSCTIVDEFHEHDTPELYDTMDTGMGAREQPLKVIITTAGSNIAGPCYEKRAQVIKILAGVIKNEEIFGIIYTVDKDDDPTTEEALRKANPNYDVSVRGDYLMSRLRDARQMPSRLATFKTKHLNIWVGARNAWMNMQAWAKAPARKSLDELAGRRCIIGLDLASKIDVAALLLLFLPTEQDPYYHLHGRYYLPEEMVEDGAHANASHYAGWNKQGFLTLTPGNVIDFDRIEEDLRDFASRFDVVEVPYDPWQATQLATGLLEEGLPMVEYRATVQNFSEPMKELEKLVLQKRLAHGNCPVLTWMMSNVVAKIDAKDNIFPRKEFPQNKIDGVVALIMAIARAISNPNTKSHWE